MSLRRHLFALLFFLGFFLSSAVAHAHDEMVSSSDVVIDDHGISWRVDVGFDGLRKAVAVPRGELEEGELEALEPVIAGYLGHGVDVVADGRRLAGRPIGLEPIYEPSIVTGQPRITRVALQIQFATDKPPRAVAARVTFFSDLTTRHRALVRVWHDGMSQEHVLLGPSDLALTSPVGQPLRSSRWLEVRDFLRWGTFHIFIGYDHIAFLFGLLLATKRLWELLKVVSSFTVAHSVTILLSALDVVRIPSRLTEVMIAASIVYIALENLWGAAKGFRHRWLLAFGFGLVHGLGFATELRARLAATSGRILLPILSFNLGVELGQLVIVAMAFPLIYFVRSLGTKRAPQLFEARLLRLGSLPILGLGLLWLVQRALP